MPKPMSGSCTELPDAYNLIVDWSGLFVDVMTVSCLNGISSGYSIITLQLLYNYGMVTVLLQ